MVLPYDNNSFLHISLLFREKYNILHYGNSKGRLQVANDVLFLSHMTFHSINQSLLKGDFL